VADVHSREQRSRNMAAIRGKNTKPELKVRSALHALGYRFRLHRRDLPGNPDIVLPKHRTAIFVHGCFWHCHDCSYGKVMPATRAEFWRHKRAGNVERDKRHAAAIARLGWKVLIIWECQTREPVALKSILAANHAPVRQGSTPPTHCR
jgi:DNA mismatch endonuclease (patch repair protein)